MLVSTDPNCYKFYVCDNMIAIFSLLTIDKVQFQLRIFLINKGIINNES